MKKNLAYYFLLCALLSCKPLAYRDYMTGVQQSENLNYSEGISSYLKSWESSPMPETARGLAQAYYKVRNFEQAEEWYARLHRDQELDSTDFKGFAEVLIANSKYAEAREMLDRLDPSQSNPELNSLRQTAISGRDFLNKPTESQVGEIGELNTSFSEFGPFLSEDGMLYFTSDRLSGDSRMVDPRNALRSDVYGWTGNGFLTMYSAAWDIEQKSPSGETTQVARFESDLHVGPYFRTGTNSFITLTQAQKFDRSAKGSARDYTLYPELFFALDSDSLTIADFNPLPFNSPFDYSVSDPYYDDSQNRLYFSSDMPGGYGNADLYYVTWTAESGWSEPVNLGEKINTVENERTPYLDKQGRLFFASSGYAGIGGLDLFVAEKSGESFGKPVNLGSPINSNRDDFGFSYADADEKRAFLASDRAGGKGLDDLFWVDLNVMKELVLKGTVYDKTTGQVLQDAVVELLSEDGRVVESRVSDEIGGFRFLVEQNQTVSLLGKKTGFLDGANGGIQIPLAADFADSVLVRDLYLDKIQVGKTFRLDNIYYDFDKWAIRDDAKPELERLGKILIENPTMEIELHSHTDSRGSSAYNQRLSSKRAQSAVDYLLMLGIARGRLDAVGFGESQLLNTCSDGADCTEEQHQENRRTEFKIVAY